MMVMLHNDKELVDKKTRWVRYPVLLQKLLSL